MAASVRSVLVIPMTAVRSSGFTTAAMKVARGAWSMLLRPARMKSRTIDIQKCDGKPKRNTAAEDGTWVKTMVLIKPILRANGPAKMLEIAPRR